jgi:signal transduction histidine kinase
VTAVHLLLVAGLTFEVVRRQQDFLFQQSRNRAADLARLLALNSSSWVLADDVVGLAEMVAALRDHTDLRYAMVVSPEGRVLAHTDGARVGQHLTDPQSLAVLRDTPRLQVVHADEALLDVAAPVFSSTGDCIAWVRVGEGMESITHNLAAVRRDGLWFGLGATLLGAAFATGMAFRLTSRIRGLLAVSDGVRAGQSGLRARVGGGDELAELGVAFDAMLDGIQQRERENALLEAELLHAQRLESVGRLAGGVAHDFNNLLTAIVGNALLLQERLPAGPLRTGAEDILDAGHRATEVTRGLLAFSRKQLLAPARLDLREVVQGTDRLLARLIGEDIQVSLRVPDQPLEIVGNRGQLEQVLMNLGVNARDAMPGGGTLTVEASAVELGAAEATARGLSGRRAALVAVRDDGCGMTEETRARIFDPFFTTKEVGKGTGLGLSMAYGTLRQHGGFIEVESAPGRGTTVRLYVPLAPPASGEPSKDGAGAAPAPAGPSPPRPGIPAGAPGGGPPLPAPSPPGARAGETVLLAEDDETVRTFATRVLREAGYRVIVAPDGEEAVRLFTEHRGDISLCLFDLVMPRRSGRAAGREVHHLAPGTPVLFVSGHSPETTFVELSAAEDAALLRKPYLPLQLLARVREALDRSGAGA